MMKWKKLKKVGGSLAAAAAIACLFFTAHTAKAVKKAEGVIAEGIRIEDISVGGMTEEEARVLVQKRVDSMEKGILELLFNGAVSQVTFEELGFVWENPSVVEEAAECGQHGNLLERYKELKMLETEGKEYRILYHIDEELLDAYLEAQAKTYQTDAVEAKITKDGKKFSVSRSQDGLTVNLESTREKIRNAMASSWSGGTLTLEADTQVLKPRLITEELELIKDCLADYSTPYNPGNVSRSVNLVNATHFIDGEVLLPGETMSLYDYLYPCTEENGYQAGIAYAGGGYVDSIGGGICQVSTTLYNALLYSELKVLTRAPHSMTVSYVEPGFDSAQAEGSKDLSFRNSTDYPIYVEAWAKKGKLYCAIWGVETRPETHKVRYYNNILSRVSPGEPEITEDPNLPEGEMVWDQDSYDAITVELYREISENGKVVETTLLHTDRYKASPAKIRIGTGAALPPADNPS